jgi:hypothetical protein
LAWRSAKETAVQNSNVQQQERRRHDRREPDAGIRVRRALPVLPLSDAVVLNTSPGGVAIRTSIPLNSGDRLSFAVHPNQPPILAEVLAREPLEDGVFRVRCRCLLGAFDA